MAQVVDHRLQMVYNGGMKSIVTNGGHGCKTSRVTLAHENLFALDANSIVVRVMLISYLIMIFRQVTYLLFGFFL